MAQINQPECLRSLNFVKTITKKTKIYEQALIDFPQERDLILINQALTYGSSPSNHNKCIAICKQLIRNCNDQNIVSMACWLTGYLYEHVKNNNEKALYYYLKMLDAEPDEAHCMYKISKIYFQDKNYTQALFWALKVNADEDYNNWSEKLTGDIYREQLLFDKAIEHYKIALAIEYNADAQDRLGICYALKKDFATAKSIFNTMLEKEPNNARTHFRIGSCYQDEDDYYRALHHFNKALELKPDYPEVYYMLAKLHQDNVGNYNETIEILEKGVQLLEHATKETRLLFYEKLRYLHKQLFNYKKSDFYAIQWYRWKGLPVPASLLDDDDDEDDDWF